MNLISDGGISSKNSPNYTAESFLINKKSCHCNGYKIDICITNDNKLIAIDNNTKKRANITNKYIESHNYSMLKNLNIGTQVKKNNILILDKILSVIKPETDIFLLIDTDNKINEIIDQIIKIINSNPNFKWNILCRSKKILNQLLNSEKKFKIGIIVEENNDWYYSADFYYLDKEKFNPQIIKEKLNDNLEILIDGITSKEEMNSIKNLIDVENENIYFVTKNINCLND